MVKNPPAMQETRVQPLGWEDSLKKGLATHSSIRAWRIPWTEELGGLQSMGLQRVRHDSTTDTDIYMPIYLLFQFVPLQQENSRKTSTPASLTMLKPFDCVDHNKLWKILQEMEIPDHLTCLLKNLYAGQ